MRISKITLLALLALAMNHSRENRLLLARCCQYRDIFGDAPDRRSIGIFGIPVFGISREGTMTRIPLSTADTRAQQMQDRLAMSTAEIGLSVRTTNCLEERGIFTVSDLLQCTRDDLLSISNFGEKTLDEVYKSLEGIGFYRQNAMPRLAAFTR